MSTASGWTSGSLKCSMTLSDSGRSHHSPIEMSSVTITAIRLSKFVLPALAVNKNAWSVKYSAFSKLPRLTYFWMQLLIKLILNPLWLVALKHVWKTELFDPGKFIIKSEDFGSSVFTAFFAPKFNVSCLNFFVPSSWLSVATKPDISSWLRFLLAL